VHGNGHPAVIMTIDIPDESKASMAFELQTCGITLFWVIPCRTSA
jgi:hypothetical protein